jgi:hypothetical protein
MEKNSASEDAVAPKETQDIPTVSGKYSDRSR